MKRCRWQLADPQPLLTEPICRELSIDPLLAQCLVNRGYTEPAQADAFLRPRLKQLADPFLLPDMDAAVERLHEARQRGEPVVIFGDYDVDGVTSTALLLEVLRAMGWQAESYLPHRVDEGYGLSRDGVENCLARHAPALLLAVDCGSTAVDTIAWLAEQGVDTVVLDHHQVSDPAPEACALVNPQRGERFRELCSAGLAFKLAHALVKRGRELGLPEAAAFDVRPLLDLVALGTIADLVPLRDENRILVCAGLPRLSETARPGLVALKEVARCPDRIGAYEVGFQLGPRLNAAGRLETATEALDLLLATDAGTARRLAEDLDGRNQERRAIEQSIVEHLVQDLRARFDRDRDRVIVAGEAQWHIGVVGIVASRVVREFYRPTFVIGGEGGDWRGSGRSIEGFDLAAALRECDDLLLRHGGHAMAAGLSIDPENISALRERLNEIARRELSPEQLIPPLRLDARVPLEAVSLENLIAIESLQPFGQGNPSVQVVVENLRMEGEPRAIGREAKHLRLQVESGGQRADVIWWNGAGQPLPEGRFDLACAPEINEFRGARSVRLKLLDWRATQ